MPGQARFERYEELQSYVGWTAEDAARVLSSKMLVEPVIPDLIEDFYEEIERHPNTRAVITGGSGQIERLKKTLRAWLIDLLSGCYDEAYVERRWRVGAKHVEIGLDQVYTNVALSRLRTALTHTIQDRWTGDLCEQRAVVRSLNKLLDLDLALIEDAYQSILGNRLQQNERLATLGQVAGGVAHELRNPLNVVKTSVYFLLHARNASEEKRQQHLKRIERHVERADGVISALSSFARMPVPTLQPLSVEQVVRETLELEGTSPTIQVDLEFFPDLPPVLADGDQLRIVLGNIIRNAYDAMPQGGRLTICARRRNGSVAVDLTDTGTGISPDDLSRIMEPLYSTKARGLGLGLAIVRTILEKNRGTLAVTSEPGAGSTFTVQLEANGARSESESESDTEAEGEQ